MNQFKTNELFILPCYQFEKGAWRERGSRMKVSDEPISVDGLKVVTWNVLFPFFHPEELHTDIRTQALCELLGKTDADIIGLEEVTPMFLEHLLAQEWVRKFYYSSDYKGATVVPYGQLILSKFPFTSRLWCFSKHKRVVIASSIVNNRVLRTASIHLTSSHHDAFESVDSIERRQRQLAKVYDLITAPDSGDDAAIPVDALIIGDFNSADGEPGEDLLIRSDFPDAWLKLHPGEPGLTFDPSVNPLAELNSVTQESKRLDRIIWSSSLWAPTEIHLLGQQPIRKSLTKALFASDHFGVCASFGLDSAPAQELKGPEIDEKDTSLAWLANAQLSNLLVGCFETAAGNALRDQAVTMMRGLLEAMVVGCPVFAYPFGSFMLGTHGPDSDIDMLCLSTIKRKEFFPQVVQAILNHPDFNLVNQIKEDEALVPLIRVRYQSRIFIDLLYCQLPTTLASPQYFGPQAIRSFSASHLPQAAYRSIDLKSSLSLNGLRDSCLMLRLAPQVDLYRQLCGAVGLWANSKGLKGHRFGFLGGYSWSLLCLHICQRFPRVTSSAVLLRKFFQYYAAVDWKQHVIACDEEDGKRPKFNRGPQDRMVIVSACTPHVNSSRATTRSTVHVMSSAFKEALKAKDFDELCGQTSFFTQYAFLLRLDVSAVTLTEFVHFSGAVEAKIPTLLAFVESGVPDALLCPNPRRYTPPRSTGYPFSTSYYIGVGKLETATRAGKKGAQFVEALARFTSIVDQMTSATKAFSLHQVKRDANFAEPHPLQQLQEEEQEAKRPQDDGDDDDDDDYDDRGHGNHKGGGGGKGAGGKPIRTSKEVYHRIKWDTTFDQDLYTIVYKDRFLGMKEQAFTAFHTDESHDDWMPWHRVWQFKCNGEVVWDRKERIDKIFEK